jgi:glycine cleavage system H protein
MVPEELQYTEEHEWVSVEDKIATIGISQFATEELGEIVFAELPKEGQSFNQMSEFGSIESVKTVSSLYSPVSGTITEVNQNVVDNPVLINEAPYQDGWLIKIELEDESELEQLMSSADYKKHIEDS